MNAPRRAPRQRVDGVLLFDKPVGLSSNQAMQTVRRLYQAEKVGHTGTLDPMATGLLPLCFGEATKFSGELLDADKRYLATLQLGVTTDTADAEGAVLLTRPVAVSRPALDAALEKFRGAIEQIPPMHSALKRDGKPLYEYARAGIELERQPRSVQIHELTLIDWRDDVLVLDVLCSKGTYIRTLAADIGETLGCGAHLTALRRTTAGTQDIDRAIALPQLEAMSPQERLAALLPADHLLHQLDIARLDERGTHSMLHGQAVAWAAASGTRLRIYGADQRFLGLGRVNGDGKLQPERLVATA